MALLVLAGSAAGAQEAVIARCETADGTQRIVISERDGAAFWTEGDRRVEAQMIREQPTDAILGITSNRLDGSISMLTLERPPSDAGRRRAAALSIHRAGAGRIDVESYSATCDVERP